MARPTISHQRRNTARVRLLGAAKKIIHETGYAGASVEDICMQAGVTKGAFFHHFKSKQDFGVAVAQFWSEWARADFANAPYQNAADPLDRVLGYLEFRASLITKNACDLMCLLGAMAQETYIAHPAIRDACAVGIFAHAALLEADLAAALKARNVKPSWSPKALSDHIEASIQGAFVLTKAAADTRPVIEGLAHLDAYVRLLFNDCRPPTKAVAFDELSRAMPTQSQTDRAGA